MTVFCKSVIYIPKFALVFEECAYWEVSPLYLTEGKKERRKGKGKN